MEQQSKPFTQKNIWSGIGWSLWRTFVGSLMFNLLIAIVAVIAYVITNQGSFTSSGFDEYTDMPTVMSIMMLANHILVFLWFNFRYKPDFKLGKLSSKPAYVSLSLFTLLFLAYLIPGEVITESIVGDADEDVIKAIANIIQNPIGIFNVSLFGPICEEIIFRACVLGFLLKLSWKPWCAILFSAFLFALVHANLTQGINAFGMGIILGYIYIRTESIWSCIYIHVLNNTLFCIMALLYGTEISTKEFLGLNGVSLWGLVAVCLVVLAIALNKVRMVYK